MAYEFGRRARMALPSVTTLLAFAAPAHAADQFKQAADGAGIECSVSARELTRFALVGDQFASVSKMSTGMPYNDFAVTNEPIRGDIYVSVPETYAAGSISFFATTKKGFVYKVSCRVEPITAAQVFIANPAIATNQAASWESETPLATSAVRLVQAMAGDRTIEGFEVRQATALPSRVGDLEIQLLSHYRGASLAGKVVRITNRGRQSITLAERDLAPRDSLAVSIVNPALDPGNSTTAFVVGLGGESSHD